MNVTLYIVAVDGLSYMIEFIQQKHDSTCAIISLLNAKRFYGYDTPAYGDTEFEYLIDLARARYGSAIDVESVARHLGLNRQPIPRAGAHFHFPFTFACFPPKLRCHDVLAIAGDSATWQVVNYRGPYGPVVDWVTVKDLQIVPTWQDCDHDFRKFWHITIGEQ
jgi:hypothetical protein